MGRLVVLLGGGALLALLRRRRVADRAAAGQVWAQAVAADRERDAGAAGVRSEPAEPDRWAATWTSTA
jgi:hypothetical protein